MQHKTAYVILAICIAFNSCKKDTAIPASPLASVNIVNATVGLSPVKVNFTGGKEGTPNYWAAITTTIAYGANAAYTVNANTNVPVTICSSTDSTHPIFVNTFNYPN